MSLDEISRGLASGTISRRRALALLGAGAAATVFPFARTAGATVVGDPCEKDTDCPKDCECKDNKCVPKDKACKKKDCNPFDVPSGSHRCGPPDKCTCKVKKTYEHCSKEDCEKGKNGCPPPGHAGECKSKEKAA
jgi:hypothetical protein